MEKLSWRKIETFFNIFHESCSITCCVLFNTIMKIQKFSLY